MLVNLFNACLQFQLGAALVSGHAALCGDVISLSLSHPPIQVGYLCVCHRLHFSHEAHSSFSCLHHDNMIAIYDVRCIKIKNIKPKYSFYCMNLS